MTKTLTILFAGMLLIALVGCSGSDTDNESSNRTQATSNNTSPANTATTSAGTGDISFSAYDIDGTLRKSSEWIGHQPVVINFWGTWCPPCRREVPDLVRVYNEYRDQGIEIVGIAVRDQPTKVRQFAAQNNMEWVMLMVDQNVIEAFPNIRNVPTTIFLDKDGNEVQRFVGGRDYETFKQAFEQLL